ncbi:hypothetical protein [Myxococcus sp. RHSTA-1-4]|uniref:hypothetical protein n=1 Tax=Myxococcus sp. RHSTA-1-4 TaxID=2874601 RepID=UPI001CC0BC62|nr:hypothetical protein [Myxococcus sp. RHSTA-1-4]
MAWHVRLADIAAAPSCFPGGFEPRVFPQQFHWPREYPLSASLEELGPGFNGGLPLMGGGIHDNQGGDSLLLAFEGARSMAAWTQCRSAPLTASGARPNGRACSQTSSPPLPPSWMR